MCSHSCSVKCWSWVSLSLLLIIGSTACLLLALLDWEEQDHRELYSAGTHQSNFSGYLYDYQPAEEYSFEYNSNRDKTYGAVLVLATSGDDVCIKATLIHHSNFGFEGAGLDENGTIYSSCTVESCYDTTMCELSLDGFWGESDVLTVVVHDCSNVWSSDCYYMVKVQYLTVLPIHEKIKYSIPFYYSMSEFLMYERISWFYYSGDVSKLESLSMLSHGGTSIWMDCLDVSDFPRSLIVTERFGDWRKMNTTYLMSRQAYKHDEHAKYTSKFACHTPISILFTWYKQTLSISRTSFSDLLLIGVYLNATDANLQKDYLTMDPVLRISADKKLTIGGWRLWTVILGCVSFCGAVVATYFAKKACDTFEPRQVALLPKPNPVQI